MIEGVEEGLEVADVDWAGGEVGGEWRLEWFWRCLGSAQGADVAGGYAEEGAGEGGEEE